MLKKKTKIIINCNQCFRKLPVEFTTTQDALRWCSDQKNALLFGWEFDVLRGVDKCEVKAICNKCVERKKEFRRG